MRGAASVAERRRAAVGRERGGAGRSTVWRPSEPASGTTHGQANSERKDERRKESSNIFEEEWNYESMVLEYW